MQPANLPTRTLGFGVGVHVYPLRSRRVTLGLGGNMVMTRGSKSLETVDGTLRITVTDLPAAQREIPAAIADAGAALRRFEIEEASLEDVFVELVGGPSP